MPAQCQLQAALQGEVCTLPSPVAACQAVGHLFLPVPNSGSLFTLIFFHCCLMGCQVHEEPNLDMMAPACSTLVVLGAAHRPLSLPTSRECHRGRRPLHADQQCVGGREEGGGAAQWRRSTGMQSNARWTIAHCIQDSPAAPSLRVHSPGWASSMSGHRVCCQAVQVYVGQARGTGKLLSTHKEQAGRGDSRLQGQKETAAAAFPDDAFADAAMASPAATSAAAAGGGPHRVLGSGVRGAKLDFIAR